MGVRGSGLGNIKSKKREAIGIRKMRNAEKTQRQKEQRKVLRNL